ncbi:MULTISPECIES: hypothetical protein [unclassified Cryobacterium]|uniref:hypothetical protein n=1 Tax=unclassified Cryobacterium TaxID=2649013 RepID=UPI002AB5B827|nr:MULTISPECIES: hypothetical protein [unclassified Cryobacterium]MDY7528443.1 hypothetical protein [Cryobacterium sp. 10C2]MDY7555812.1 hypothetical protein [Cryobacterium sp. 10C3]MEB0289163.1 hypothetical protein [Cryobacterium sp. 10C2]
MTDPGFPLLEGGIIPRRFLPGNIGGGPQDESFAFSGALDTIRSGVLGWTSPWWASIRPLGLTVTIGTMPSAGASSPNTSFDLIVGSVVAGTVTVTDSNDYAAMDVFTIDTIGPATRITVDLSKWSNAAPVKTGNAVVQFWWEYVID